MSQQLGAPTGMHNAPSAAVAPPTPAAVIVTSGSQYLRLKRRNQTFFEHCEPQELLSAVKFRLAAKLGIDEEDIRFYECMTPERRRTVMTLLEEKLIETMKSRKKKIGSETKTLEEELKNIEIPPLPMEKKLWELGLENDSIVYFVYRTHPQSDWDEWESPTDPTQTIGTCAGITPPDEAAAAKASAEATAAQAQAQAARDEEMK